MPIEATQDKMLFRKARDQDIHPQVVKLLAVKRDVFL
jgi:hypothetical protein